MHQSGIFDEVRERLILRRGGVAVFNRLSPRRTAHIVVDLQNGFMAPGQVAEVPGGPRNRTQCQSYQRRPCAPQADCGLYAAHSRCRGDPHMVGLL